MRMIRLTDAISAVEELFSERNMGSVDGEDYKYYTVEKDFINILLERLINAEHVELDNHHLEMLRRLGLWSEIPYIIFKASKENNKTIQEIWNNQHKYKYRTSGDTK